MREIFSSEIKKIKNEIKKKKNDRLPNLLNF